MFELWRQRWRSFREQPAGERFQGRYRRRANRSGILRKTVMMLLGLFLLVIGVAMIVLPGPGLICVFFGAGLLAEESLFAARLLDRVDLAIDRGIARWRRRRPHTSD